MYISLRSGQLALMILYWTHKILSREVAGINITITIAFLFLQFLLVHHGTLT